MGLCNDPSTRFLRKLGYNVVRHPQEGLGPLFLIGHQNKEFLTLGTLDQLITEPPAGVALPEIDEDRATGGIDGQESSAITLGVGLNLLNSVLSALGGGAALDASHTNARKVRFVYHDVLADFVLPLAVGDYLREAVVDAGNHVLKQYVLGNGRLYLITKTVKSRKFSVKYEGKGGTEARVDVPAIKRVVDVSGSVKAEQVRENEVAFEGEKHLAFGFQCFEVGVLEGELTLVNAKAGKQFVSADEEENEGVLLREDGLLHLESDLEPVGN